VQGAVPSEKKNKVVLAWTTELKQEQASSSMKGLLSMVWFAAYVVSRSADDIHLIHMPKAELLMF
jgi:hypothetical protein